MRKENQAEFDILGITKWHKLGYKGQGIKVVNLEMTYPAYFFKDNLGETFDYMLSSKPNIHGQKTMDCINQVLPEATLYPLSNGNTRFIEDTMPFILDNGIHLVSASLGGTRTNEKEDILFKKCIDKGVIFTTSAGNNGIDGLGAYAKNPFFINVGAVHYTNNQIVLRKYSSIGEELNFTSFSNLWLRHGTEVGRLIPTQQGTSFSNPIFNGMLGLVQQFFIEKTGRTLYKDEMEVFLIDHVIDLGEVGWDNKYGHGLFVLPNPDDIVVSKYIKVVQPIIIPIKKPIIEDPIIEKPIAEEPIETPMPTPTPTPNPTKIYEIGLNAGHSMVTSGKRCLKSIDSNETREWFLNNKIAIKIEEKLKDYEDIVVYRLDDKTGQRDIPLKERTDKANELKLDFVDDIHHNADINGGSGGGIIVIRNLTTSQTTKDYQDIMYDKLIKHTGLKGNRSSPKPTQDLHMCRETDMPTLTVEHGFMDSITDTPIILTDKFAEQCANAHVEFYVDVFNLKKKEVINTDTLYRVQVGAYKNKATAEKLLDDLKKAGFNGFISATKIETPIIPPKVEAPINPPIINPIPSTNGYRKIIRFNSDVHIYEVSKDELVDVELGKRNTLETVSIIMKNKLAEGKKVKVGINCGFFDWNSNKDHLGMYIDEGLYYFPPHNAQIDFIYYKDGTTEIKNLHGYNQKVLSELQSKTNWAIGTSYSLVQYGKINLENSEKYDHATAKNPRTLLGQKKDGTFLLVVVDGRSSTSSGVTAQQSAELMYELGCYNAVNNDGGGSSTMVIVENGKPIVKNKPSDINERAVGSVVLVFGN